MSLLNIQPREYQQKIFVTTKDNNTLVVLPTGLGKTLIALLLAIDRLKSFPLKKVLFLAPTKPLVEQHFEYFKKNIPELFADLQLFTGSVEAPKRKKIWQTAEIIFSTPQCISNDIEHHLYDLKDLSLLIIDEAHRCLKNYDYTKVVAKYKQQAPQNQQRILGLTASPGTSSEVINQICQHLSIEEIELRHRSSEDVEPYIQKLEFQKIEVPFPKEFIELRILLKRIFDNAVNKLKSSNFLHEPANKITLLKLQNRLAMQVASRNFAAMHGMSLTATAIKISHALELLETQTLSGLHTYLKGLQQQAIDKKSKAVQALVKMPEFNACFISLESLLANKMEHPKIQELVALTEKEFTSNENSKLIVFTQFRDTASLIHHHLSQIPQAKPAIFVGQAKKETKHGSTGLSQKDQKRIIEQFKTNEINILIATSIGEEGLDIPEVNAVFFYEPIPSAIRKIQRCLPRDSKILMSNGTYKTIYELTIGEEVVSFNEKKGVFEHKKITKKYSNREKDLIEITTEKNNKIILTKNHPLLSINGWKEAGQIKEGDRIALAHSYQIKKGLRFFSELIPEDTYVNQPKILKDILEKSNKSYKEVTNLLKEYNLNKKTLWSYANRDAIPLNKLIAIAQRLDIQKEEILCEINQVKSRKGKIISIPKEISSEFMWLVGFIASDGDFRIDERIRKNRKTKERTYRFRVCNNNKKLLEKAKRIFQSFGLRTYEDKNKGTIESSNTIMGQILREFGLPFGKKSKTLELSEKIFRLDNQAIEGFIAGYYDGDGSFNKKTTHIRIGTGSKALSHQLQSLLLRLGILSKIVIIDKNETRNIKGKTVIFTGNFYSVEIYRKIDVKKVLNFREITKTKENISYNFTKNNDKNIFWVRIDSIKDINRDETYNLEIEDNNTFIANDMIVHNSGRTARLAPGKLFILVTTDTRDEINHWASAARERKMYKTIQLVKDELKNRKKSPTLDNFKP